MYYPDSEEYITFLFSMLDEFSASQKTGPKRGRPRDLCRYVPHRLLHIYAPQGDHHYAGTTPVFVPSPTAP